MTPVLLIWQDAHYRNEEVSVDEAKALGPEVTHSVGYLVAQTEAATVLGMSAWPGHPGRFSEYLVVPRLMILSTRELVEGEGEE